MQTVNDDLDELWRRAGNEYPLNTSGADWNKLSAKLGIPPTPKRKDRRYLWLLLLLLVPVVCIRPFPLGLGERSGHDAALRQEKVAPAASASPDGRTLRAAASPANTAGPESPSPEEGAPDSGDRISTGAASISSTPHSPVSVAPSTSPTAATKSTITVGARQRAGRRTGSSVAATARKGASAGSLPAAASVKQRMQKPAAASGDPDAAKPAIANAQADARNPGALIPHPVPVPPDTTRNAATAKVVAAATTTTDSTLAPASAAAKAKPPHAPHFYAGIVAGAGITTVKRQKVHAPGYDIGVALGYQANRHVAVEAQVLWSRKHYYSHGKYLKNDLSYLPQYSYVRSVDGDCRMFEIPVTLHYSFRFRQRGNWFASAGVSSYLMKREEYGYEVHNVFTNYDGHYDTTLRNATRDWGAVLQLSAGYRFALPRSYSLRFEPYVQVPLRDAGAGRLPLTSMGMRVALLKSIF